MGNLQVKAIRSREKKKIILPWILYDIQLFFRRLVQFFKWIPAIWGDVQWDHSSIFDLLQKKLELMHEFYSGDIPHIADKDDVAQEIEDVIVILRRIRDNRYLLVALEDFDKKYPDYNWNHWMDEDENGYLRMDKDDAADQKKMKNKAYRLSDKMEKEDLDNLFILLRKNIQNWWD